MSDRDEVNEAMLELHFHEPLRQVMETTFGLSVHRLLKPSPQQEAFLGFDQGWVRTTDPEITVDSLRKELRKQIQDGRSNSPSLYFGYFLQFKVVQACGSTSSYVPEGFSGKFYRSELRTDRSKRSGLYQHETLIRLSAIAKTDVYYACPMVLDAADVCQRANLDKLRLVEVTPSTPPYKEGERHFVAFQTPTGSPVYCSSTPTPGTGRHVRDWLGAARDRLRNLEALVGWLGEVAAAARGSEHEHVVPYPESLRIVELTPKGQESTFASMGRALEF